MKLQRAIDIYLKQCKKTKSLKTWKGYKGRLKWLGICYGDRDVEKVKAKHIKRWIKWATHWQKGPEKGQPKADHTIRLTIIAWEQLQKLMLKRGWIKEPIFDYGPKPSGKKRTKIPTPLEQAKVFREALRAKKNEFALVFHCLRLCGARPGELCNANIEHWDRDLNAIVLAEHKTAKKTQEDRLFGNRVLGWFLNDKRHFLRGVICA